MFGVLRTDAGARASILVLDNSGGQAARWPVLLIGADVLVGVQLPHVVGLHNIVNGMVRHRLWNASRVLAGIKRIVTPTTEAGAWAGMRRAAQGTAASAINRRRFVSHMARVQWYLAIDRPWHNPRAAPIDEMRPTSGLGADNGGGLDVGVADGGWGRGDARDQGGGGGGLAVDGLAGCGGRRGAAGHHHCVGLPRRGKLGGGDHATRIQHLVHLRGGVRLAAAVTAARDKTLDSPNPQRRHGPHGICAAACACAAARPARQNATVGRLVLAGDGGVLRGDGQVLPARAGAGAGGLAKGVQQAAGLAGGVGPVAGHGEGHSRPHGRGASTRCSTHAKASLLKHTTRITINKCHGGGIHKVQLQTMKVFISTTNFQVTTTRSNYIF